MQAITLAVPPQTRQVHSIDGEPDRETAIEPAAAGIGEITLVAQAGWQACHGGRGDRLVLDK